MKARALLVVFGLTITSLAATIPRGALAFMPNPNTADWTDHSKPILIGVDLLPQHFATIRITPKGGGKFDFDMRCENGQRGSKTDGTFVLQFLAGDQTLAVYQQYCRVDRPEFVGSQQVKNFHQDLDLSRVIDKITKVRMSATARWTPPQPRPPAPPIDTPVSPFVPPPSQTGQ
jgi:hypothetical protein